MRFRDLYEYRTRDWSVNQAKDLRKKGWTYENIGKKFGVTGTAIWKAIHEPSHRISKAEVKRTLGRPGRFTDVWHSDSRNIDIVEARGEGIVSFRLIHYPDSKRMHFDYLRVDDSPQGKKAARDCIKFVHNMMRKTGTKSIDLDAALESGGYVWAKCGFSLEYPEGFMRSGGFNERINITIETLLENEENGRELSQKIMRIVEEDGKRLNINLANLDDPISKDSYKEILEKCLGGSGPKEFKLNKILARGTRNPTLGKVLLLGISYNAEMQREEIGSLLKWVNRIPEKTDLKEAKVRGILLVDLLMKAIDAMLEKKRDAQN